MISPKNKRVQVTLPNETVELLESLSKRYNKSSSELVKWAINVLAAKKKHNITFMIRESKIEDNPISEEESNEILEYFKDKEPENKDEDFIPF